MEKKKKKKKNRRRGARTEQNEQLDQRIAFAEIVFWFAHLRVDLHLINDFGRRSIVDLCFTIGDGSVVPLPKSFPGRK